MITMDVNCPTCGAEAGRKCLNIKTNKPVVHLHVARTLISIEQAVEAGIERIRKPGWACKFDHLKLDIINGQLGPWIHLYSPFNNSINGRDPVDILRGTKFSPVEGEKNKEFTVYLGPSSEESEYQSEVKRFNEIN